MNNTNELKSEKKKLLSIIEKYDKSSLVNCFYLNGNKLWLTPSERTNYLETLRNAKESGIVSIEYIGVKVPVDSAIEMLKKVNLYAMQCVLVTEAHKAEVNAAMRLDDLRDYNYRKGYPTRLTFICE